jgi:hypothetical protein
LDIFRRLFVIWELQAWAEVLEIVGAIAAVSGFFITLFVKKELNKLRISFIFDKRIKDHLKNITQSAQDINNYLNDYDRNKELIKTELGTCQSELEDIITKLNFRQSWKCRKLVKYIESRKHKFFISKKDSLEKTSNLLKKRFTFYYCTTYDDIWVIYNQLHEIIRQIENFKKNKEKALKP